MKHILTLSILALFAGSCKKDSLSTNCPEPKVTSGTCITDSATISAALMGKWVWVQRTIGNEKSNPCTLNRKEDHYFVFFEDGTLYDGLDMACTLVGRYSINKTAYLTSYVDTMYKYKTLEGQIKICNNYLVVQHATYGGTVDIYKKE